MAAKQDSEIDAASVQAPPRKRRAMAKRSDVRKVVQKKKGHLAVFLNLPLDLFNMVRRFRYATSAYGSHLFVIDHELSLARRYSYSFSGQSVLSRLIDAPLFSVNLEGC